jgi:hypothetical protein
MLESLFTLFIFATVIVWYLGNGYVNSQKKKAVLENDIEGFKEASRNADKAQKMRPSDVNDAIDGL